MGKRRRRAAMHQRHLNTFYGHGALLSLQPSWHFCPILSRKNNLVGSHLHRCFGPCHPELSSPFTDPPLPPPHPTSTTPPTDKYTNCVCAAFTAPPPSVLCLYKTTNYQINIPNSPQSPFTVLGRGTLKVARQQV